MAVLKDLEVTVESAGESLKETPDEGADHGHDTLVNYIAAKQEMLFGIRIKVNRTFRFTCSKLSFGIFLDGKHAESSFVTQAAVKKTVNGYDMLRNGVHTMRGRTWSHLPFMFSEEHEDEEGKEEEEADTEYTLALFGESQKGSITVKIYRCQGKLNLGRQSNFGETPAPVNPYVELLGLPRAQNYVTEDGQVTSAPERGPDEDNTEDVKPKRSISTTYIDAANTPFAVFTFKYRPAEALQRIEAGTWTPTPEPAAENIEVEPPLSTTQRQSTPQAQVHLDEIPVKKTKVEETKPGVKPDVKMDFKPEKSDEDPDIGLLQAEYEVAQARLNLMRARSKRSGTKAGVKRERVKREDDDDLEEGFILKRARFRPFKKGEVVDLCKD